MMHRPFSIAIVGVGQLGFRHLQGLLQIKLDCMFYVVDLSEATLRNVQSRIETIRDSNNHNKIKYCSSYRHLPDHIDYAVISTTSDVRLESIKALTSGRMVSYLLLEKVLFQRISEYGTAAYLLDSLETKTWVNCSRRAFSIYDTVKDFFREEQLSHFQVHGNNWGIGCNSIHFLDLLCFLTNEEVKSVDTTRLDASIVPSKRKGFVEFTGTLRGTVGSTFFELTSVLYPVAQATITFRSEKKTCIVDEANGQAFFFDSALNKPWSQRSFKLPHVSEQSGEFASDALLGNALKLPSFDSSVDIHLPLVKALADYTTQLLSTEKNFCPIT